jgi:hypothetical protein
MVAVHHKQHSTNCTYLETFQEKIFKIQSTASGAVSRAQTEMEIRKTTGTSAHLCYLPKALVSSGSGTVIQRP